MNDVPLQGHARSPALYLNSIFRAPDKSESTSPKYTDRMTTRIRTTEVEANVSFLVGQVTLRSSIRTSRKNWRIFSGSPGPESGAFLGAVFLADTVSLFFLSSALASADLASFRSAGVPVFLSFFPVAIYPD